MDKKYNNSLETMKVTFKNIKQHACRFLTRQVVYFTLALGMLFSFPLYAQDKSQSSPFGVLIPFVFVIAIFYFLLIRPQQKRQKKMDKKKEDIKKGDIFITSGGLYAKVDHFKNDGKVVVAEISSGVRVEMVRAMIADVVVRDENSADSNPQDKNKKTKKTKK